MQQRATSASVEAAAAASTWSSAERSTPSAGDVVAATQIPADAMALDIGPATVEALRRAILRARRRVFWNGPMGLFEKPAVRRGHARRRARAAPTARASPWSAAATAPRPCNQAGLARPLHAHLDRRRRVARAPRGQEAARASRRCAREPASCDGRSSPATGSCTTRCAESRALAARRARAARGAAAVDVAVAPVFTALAAVREALAGSAVALARAERATGRTRARSPAR